MVPLPFGPFAGSGCCCCRAWITFLFAFRPVVAVAAAVGRSFPFLFRFSSFFLNANLWACVAIWLPLGNFSAHRNTELKTHSNIATATATQQQHNSNRNTNRNRKCSKRNKKWSKLHIYESVNCLYFYAFGIWGYCCCCFHRISQVVICPLFRWLLLLCFSVALVAQQRFCIFFQIEKILSFGLFILVFPNVCLCRNIYFQ